MNKIFLVVPAFCLLLFSCGSETKPIAETVTVSVPAKDTSLAFFGDTITLDGAVAADQVEKQLEGKDSIAMKVTGKIEDVCQKKGCWMTMNVGNNKTMRVTFKDYAFFVPKNGSGNIATIDGYGYIKRLSLAETKEYAKDEGKTKAEIDTIKTPITELSFEARGVIIKK